MDEKKIEALQKKSRRSYYFAAAFSAAVFLAITSVLFFLLLTTPSGIAYLEESPKEMITGVIVPARPSGRGNLSPSVLSVCKDNL